MANFPDYNRSENPDCHLKSKYCHLDQQNKNNFNIEEQSDYKSRKIFELISNIYIYKFPPILNWPDGINFDIPVEFVITIREILEHFSELVLYNIQELCFSLNTNYSSFGDKILIIPYEYITGTFDKKRFPDVFAHEVGHSLLIELIKDKKFKNQLKKWHRILRYHSIKSGNTLFFAPENSCSYLAKYQFEDYREFFSETCSNLLNHYDELIQFICKIENKSQKAYLKLIDYLENLIVPFSKPDY